MLARGTIITATAFGSTLRSARRHRTAGADRARLLCGRAMRGSDSHRGNSLRGCHLILRSPRFLYRNSSSNSCGAMGSRRGGGRRGTHDRRDMCRHLFWLGNLRMIRKGVKSRSLCRSGCRGLYLRRLRGSTCRRSRRHRARSGLLCSAGYRSRSRRRRSDWPHGTRGRGRVCRYRAGRRCTGRAARGRNAHELSGLPSRRITRRCGWARRKRHGLGRDLRRHLRGRRLLGLGRRRKARAHRTGRPCRLEGVCRSLWIGRGRRSSRGGCEMRAGLYHAHTRLPRHMTTTRHSASPIGMCHIGHALPHFLRCRV